MGALPLAGVKVLDLSRLLPGPYATLVLADLGAQVDKVEEPGGGDYLRQTPPLREGESALFYGLNRNKRSLTLDLKTPRGVEALGRLAGHYDVLVESFRPGVMERLGLGEATLRARHPGLVYCALSGYGQTGPDRLKAGHDLNYVARAGVLGYSGAAEDMPAASGGQMADIGGSLFAVIGILAALHERARTGLGRLVDISMTESAMAFIHMQLAARLVLGDAGAPLARGREVLNGGIAHYGVYRTQDGKALAVGALEPKFLAGLCARLGRAELATEAQHPGEAGERVRGEFQRIFASAPLAHWTALLGPADLCIEPVHEGDDVLLDAQLVARGLFASAEDASRD